MRRGAGKGGVLVREGAETSDIVLLQWTRGIHTRRPPGPWFDAGARGAVDSSFTETGRSCCSRRYGRSCCRPVQCESRTWVCIH